MKKLIEEIMYAAGRIIGKDFNETYLCSFMLSIGILGKLQFYLYVFLLSIFFFILIIFFLS